MQVTTQSWKESHGAVAAQHPAQPLLHDFPSMQVTTQSWRPKHLVPQDVISACHWAWFWSAFHLLVSASLQLASGASKAILGASKPVQASTKGLCVAPSSFEASDAVWSTATDAFRETIRCGALLKITPASCAATAP